MTKIGHDVGLISDERYNKFLIKKENIEKEINRCKSKTIKPTDKVNEFLKQNNSSTINVGVKLSDLIKRTELTYNKLEQIDDERPELSKAEREQVEIQIKYEGYIKLQEKQVEEFKKLENKKLPNNIDYNEIKGISLEARQKLNEYKPSSVGQASRISGISPADISVLLIYLEKMKREYRVTKINVVEL